MSIFYAELQVLGRQVPCAQATFSFRQAIDQAGRPSSDVRIELLKVTLTGEPASWKIWPELKLNDFRRVSGWVLYFDSQGRTAKRYAFYDAALISLEFRYDGRGTQGKQAATQVELHFSPATVEVDGQRLEAYSRIPWKTNPQTSFRVLTKPLDPQPSPHLAALLATAKLKAEELGTGLLQKVLTPAGEAATEFLGVGLAALARTASLTAGLLLTPTNSRDDPGYAAEWELYRRNQHHGTPLTPDQLRLAQLERLHEQGDLTAEEEAELIALLAKVKGIHIQKISDLAVEGPLRGDPVLLPGFHNIRLNYTKRSKTDLKALRDKFDTSARKEFLKKLGNDPQAVQKLKNAGLTSDELRRVVDGKVPNLEWQVHHKLPLDDGGDNSFDNLVLIKNDPYHKAITNLQNASIRGMQPGETRVLSWPICPGSIYPN